MLSNVDTYRGHRWTTLEIRLLSLQVAPPGMQHQGIDLETGQEAW